jgi:hypothetical protein
MMKLTPADVEPDLVRAFVNRAVRELKNPYLIVVDVSRADAATMIPPEGFRRLDGFLIRGFNDAEKATHFIMMHHRPTLPLKLIEGIKQ